MRSDLEKLKGIQDITTDYMKNVATFKIAIPQADLKKRLDEVAKKNEHMKGWTFMEPKKDDKKDA